MSDVKRICVIGGGASGMMAAGTAAQYGAQVTIFEHNILGKKLSITGKGRCNVTNDSSVNELLNNVTKNSKFLYSAFNAFSAQDTINFFENLGLKLKVERGCRVFPKSDNAWDVVYALKKYVSSCKIIYHNVLNVTQNSDKSFTVSADKKYIFDSVIIATGGKSYAQTGSDGSGYILSKKLGHCITELTPSLIPIESTSSICKELQGLSLKNVAIKVLDRNGQTVYTDFGEMMFTHFGVTGPVILSASAHLRKYDISNLTLSIDLKPALDDKKLDVRILSDFDEFKNKDFANSLNKLLPQKLIVPFIRKTGIDGKTKINSITKDDRKIIRYTIKNFDIPLKCFRPINEAIITSGGVDVKEIQPKTMESKLVDNLYFAGEIIDVDAYTGGFNLQVAFSTGYLAGKNSALKSED